MNIPIDALQSYEFDALLEALRRDLRAQLELAKTGGDWAQWHMSNARTGMRLLEALNPKTAASAAGRKTPVEIYNTRQTRIQKHEPVSSAVE